MPAVESLLTVAGSGAVSAIVARVLTYREKIRRIEADERKAEADMELERAKHEREASVRFITEERNRTDQALRIERGHTQSCMERLDNVQAQLRIVHADLADNRVELGRCEERHTALEERIDLLERKASSPPPAPSFLR